MTYYGLNNPWEMGGSAFTPGLAAPFLHGFGRLQVLTNRLTGLLMARCPVLPSMEDQNYLMLESVTRGALRFPYGYAVTAPLPVQLGLKVRKPIGLFSF